MNNQYDKMVSGLVGVGGSATAKDVANAIVVWAAISLTPMPFDDLILYLKGIKVANDVIEAIQVGAVVYIGNFKIGIYQDNDTGRWGLRFEIFKDFTVDDAGFTQNLYVSVTLYSNLVAQAQEVLADMKEVAPIVALTLVLALIAASAQGVASSVVIALFLLAFPK